MSRALTHLERLEAESIHIFREVVAECERPVMLYSIGKDSSVMLHLALKAFAPAKPPFPLLQIASGWDFRQMLEFRDATAKRLGLELLVYTNEAGAQAGIRPWSHGAAYADVMLTQALREALDLYGFDAAFGGARRDEEKSRAKERIFSFRSAQHRWDPKNQRPELWQLYNTRKNPGESIRVFPLSNWTELDMWQYIHVRADPDRAAVLRRCAARRAPRRPPDHGRRRSPAAVRSGSCREPQRALPHARLLSADRRHVEHGHDGAGRDSGNAAGDKLRAAGARRRSRWRRLDGAEEAGRLFLMDVEAYLRRHEQKSLLRFITCGSVDDGKSTLIGRLLFESKMIFEDQLAALESDSRRVGTRGGEIDFALLVDGLAAEREQGITIDVAYRFFSTEKRKFIVADTPGHEQYTRNMVTGASTADLAVILVDARKGVLTQTRRHSYLVCAARHPAHRAGGQQDGPGRLLRAGASRDRA